MGSGFKRGAVLFVEDPSLQCCLLQTLHFEVQSIFADLKTWCRVLLVARVVLWEAEWCAQKTWGTVCVSVKKQVVALIY